MSLCNHYLVHQNSNSSFAFALTHPHSKGQTMNDNHKDIVAAIILGLSLCAGLLAYFDILIK
jgi:hypothetical protein